MKIAIIGGGIVGLTTALFLISNDVSNQTIDKIEIIERNNEVGLETSYGPPAIVPWDNVPPRSSISLIWNYIKDLVFWRASRSVSFQNHVLWDINFYIFCIRVVFNQIMNLFIPNKTNLFKLSKEQWDLILQKNPSLSNYYFEGKSYFMVYDDVYFNELQNTLDEKKYDILSPNQLNQIEPDLKLDSMEKGDGKVVVGVISPKVGGFFQPHKLCLGIKDILESNSRVSFKLDTNIQYSQLYGELSNEYDKIIICGGIFSNQLRGFWDRLWDPMYPVLGISVDVGLESIDDPHPRNTIIDRYNSLYLRPKLVDNNTSSNTLSTTDYRISGKMIFGGRKNKVDKPEDIIQEIVEKDDNPLFSIKEYNLTGWKGVRPVSHTLKPIIKQLDDRVYLNIGHGANGFMYCWYSANKVSEMILNIGKELG